MRSKYSSSCFYRTVRERTPLPFLTHSHACRTRNQSVRHRLLDTSYSAQTTQSYIMSLPAISTSPPPTYPPTNTLPRCPNTNPNFLLICRDPTSPPSPWSGSTQWYAIRVHKTILETALPSTAATINATGVSKVKLLPALSFPLLSRDSPPFPLPPLTPPPNSPMPSTSAPSRAPRCAQ